MRHNMPPSHRKVKNQFSKIFSLGLFIVLIGESVGILLYYLSGGSPNGFLLIIYLIVLFAVAVNLANRYQFKGTFIYAAILALLGGCTAGGTLSEYRDYMKIPHKENVSLADIITTPADYDGIELFYFDSALPRKDLTGFNVVPADSISGMGATTYTVCPLVQENQKNDDIVTVGAWLVLDEGMSQMDPNAMNISNSGTLRVFTELEPYYRGAVRKSEDQYKISSDWNAPILTIAPAGSQYARPTQFFWVLFLIGFWPVLWIVTRFNLLLKK